jgi:hypothetical protein
LVTLFIFYKLSWWFIIAIVTVNTTHAYMGNAGQIGHTLAHTLPLAVVFPSASCHHHNGHPPPSKTPPTTMAWTLEYNPPFYHPFQGSTPLARWALASSTLSSPILTSRRPPPSTPSLHSPLFFLYLVGLVNNTVVPHVVPSSFSPLTLVGGPGHNTVCHKLSQTAKPATRQRLPPLTPWPHLSYPNTACTQPCHLKSARHAQLVYTKCSKPIFLT